MVANFGANQPQLAYSALFISLASGGASRGPCFCVMENDRKDEDSIKDVAFW